MRWSDPFTGWVDGWIGRGAYAGWVAVIAVVWSLALWSFLLVLPYAAAEFIGSRLDDGCAGYPESIVIVTAPGIHDLPVAAWKWLGSVALLLLAMVPILNVTAKRWRDAGLPGWSAAAVHAGLLWLIWWAGEFPVMYVLIGFLPAVMVEPDTFGRRVPREPDPAEVFE